MKSDVEWLNETSCSLHLAFWVGLRAYFLMYLFDSTIQIENVTDRHVTREDLYRDLPYSK